MCTQWVRHSHVSNKVVCLINDEIIIESCAPLAIIPELAATFTCFVCIYLPVSPSITITPMQLFRPSGPRRGARRPLFCRSFVVRHAPSQGLAGGMPSFSRKTSSKHLATDDSEEEEVAPVDLEEESVKREARAKIMKRYALYDPNGKGYVTKAELRKVMQGGTLGSPNAKYAGEVCFPQPPDMCDQRREMVLVKQLQKRSEKIRCML